MAISKLELDPTTWMEGQAPDGLPYFSEDALWNFIDNAVECSSKDTNGIAALDASDYQAAREQLWAIREVEAQRRGGSPAS